MFREIKVDGVKGVFLINKGNSAEETLIKELEKSNDMKRLLSEVNKRFFEVQFDEAMCREIVSDTINSTKMEEEEAFKFRELSHMLYRV